METRDKQRVMSAVVQIASWLAERVAPPQPQQRRYDAASKATRLSGWVAQGTDADAANATGYASSGTDIHITYTNGSGVVNDITLAGVVAAGTFIGSEADAEAALGHDFFKNAGASESATSISLDVGSATSTSTVSGAGAAVTFTDSATANSYVRITDFTSGDVIQVTGATESQYSFSSSDLDGDGSADDLSITYSNAGVTNDIQILNVVSTAAIVFDKASAVSAVGFNFITFG